jgi:hypothetical protein
MWSLKVVGVCPCNLSRRRVKDEFIALITIESVDA